MAGKRDVAASMGLDVKEFEATLNRVVTQQLTKLNAAAAKTSTAVEGIGKSSGLAARALGGFKTALGGLGLTVGIASVVSFGKSLLSFGSSIKETAESVNLSTDAFQELEHVFTQGGASSEQFQKSMVKLQQSVEDAKDGNVKLVATFERLGISWEDLFKLPLEEKIGRIADAVKNSTDPSKTLSDLLDTMGKGASRLIPALKDGADGLREVGAEADKLSKQQLAEMDALEDRWTKKWRAMKVGAIKAIFDVASELPKILGKGNGLEEMNYTGNYGMRGPGSVPDRKSGDVVTPADIANDIAETAGVDIPNSPEEIAAQKQSLDLQEQFVEAMEAEADARAEIADIYADIRRIQADAALEQLSTEGRILALEKERLKVVGTIREVDEKADALARKELVNLDSRIQKEQSILAAKRAQAQADEASRNADMTRGETQRAVDLQSLPPRERSAAKRAIAAADRNVKRAENTVAANERDADDRMRRQNPGSLEDQMRPSDSFAESFQKSYAAPKSMPAKPITTLNVKDLNATTFSLGLT